MSEIWKRIDSFDNYQVSNLGGVRSFAPRNGFTSVKEPRILKGHIRPKGYRVVELGKTVKGCRHNIRWVHRLVLETFVGPCPNGMECRHKDGNPANNALENLEWSNHAVNMQDQYEHGTRISGETHPMASLSDEQVRDIYTAVNAGKHGIGRTLAAKYGVTPATISLIKKLKTRKEAICLVSA